MGKIERIQLRGISRSPSDRMVNDGGCDESLNVQLDHGELTPMPKPEDITDRVFGELADDPAKLCVLFIHKGTYYNNYIIWRAIGPISGFPDRFVQYELCANIGDYAEIGENYVHLKSWTVVGENTSLKPEITSVGNTVIVSFNGSMWYFLFKDGVYKVLGDQIPVPRIRFHMKYDSYVDSRGNTVILERTEPAVSYPVKRTQSGITTISADTGPIDASIHNNSHDLNPDSWGSKALAYHVRQEPQLAILGSIWEEVQERMAGAVEGGKHIFPVFVRYAVRLFDGTLYACSAPILMGGELASYLAVGLKSFRTSKKEKVYVDDVHSTNYTIYQLYSVVKTPHPYFIVADFSDNSNLGWDDWKDIIEGIELYVSTPIMPMINGDTVKLTDRDAAPEDSTEYGAESEWYSAAATLDPINQLERPEELILAHQTTYLAKKWDSDKLSSMNSSVVLDDINYSGDWLTTQPALVESYGSVHKYSGDGLSSYNNRLLLEGATMKLYAGYPFYNSTALIDSNNNSSWSYAWHIRVDGEEKIVVTKTPTGSAELYYESAGDYYAKPVAFLSYPDARAFKVDVFYTVDASSITPGFPRQTRVESFIAKSFSEIDASYVFFGFGGTPTIDSTQTPGSLVNLLPDEDANVSLFDQVLLSESSNPFVFPAGGRVDFGNESIVGTGMITVPLSTGQFGYAHLYVFTSAGIWPFLLNKEGEIVKKELNMVSRDVAIKGTITPIEQAIIFTTKKGVMLLSGSEVRNISPDMNGKHYILDSESAALIDENNHAGIVMATQNPETFQQFMETAKPVYDYVGERLVFGSEEYGKYMYVYRLTAGTWHKMTLIEGDGATENTFSVIRALNSYPDAIMSLRTNNGAKVINISKVLIQDGTEDNAMDAGLIATRPIDFGLPDIYKSITRVKIRGEVDRSNNHSPFKYILLGSNDGVNWAMLHSLRGPSFKLFRLIILTTLNSTERISYAEIEYEPRFTNKIR